MGSQKGYTLWKARGSAYTLNTSRFFKLVLENISGQGAGGGTGSQFLCHFVTFIYCLNIIDLEILNFKTSRNTRWRTPEKSDKVSKVTGAVKHTIYKLNVEPTFVTSTISVFLGIPPPHHVLGETMRREEDVILLQLRDKLLLGDERSKLLVALVVRDIFEQAFDFGILVFFVEALISLDLDTLW